MPGLRRSAAAVSSTDQSSSKRHTTTARRLDVEVSQRGRVRGIADRRVDDAPIVERAHACQAAPGRTRPVEADAVHPAAGIVVRADLLPTGVRADHGFVGCFLREIEIAERDGECASDVGVRVAVEGLEVGLGSGRHDREVDQCRPARRLGHDDRAVRSGAGPAGAASATGRSWIGVWDCIAGYTPEAPGRFTVFRISGRESALTWAFRSRGSCGAPATKRASSRASGRDVVGQAASAWPRSASSSP